jgi:hypothetical protein
MWPERLTRWYTDSPFFPPFDVQIIADEGET